VVERDHAVGFDWSHEHRGGSSKHFPFDWRPDGSTEPADLLIDPDNESSCRCHA
jgi:hypothetical protein